MCEIEKLKIFNGVEKNIVDKIIENANEEIFNIGEMIFFEGESSNGKGYIIKSGEVLVKIKGREVARLYKGDIFGEIALLNEEQRTASIEAVTEVKVLTLTINSLLEMISNDENIINKEIMRRIEENISNN